ncbi:MFS transporter [Nocardia sp. NPDC051463]|uniref:MFS transporter n=1 Tax=Nocardia sp. NPDC051463 TaxID=3154845 RepID=UPI00344D6D8F
MSTTRLRPCGTTGHARAHGWVLVLLALAQLIYALDLNLVFVALPRIGADLGFPGQTQQLVVSAYVVFAGGFLLLGGRAVDLLGRRRMFVLALTLYGLASLACGLATSPVTLIAARAVQGIGGALLMPSTLALINTLFPEGPQRNRALSVWGGAGAGGLTLGALLGGVLTENFGWSAVFFVNVPLAVAVALGALAIMPAGARPTGRRAFDLPGALTVTAGVTVLVFALVEAPELGWTHPLLLLGFATAATLLAAFAVIERRSADPLMPLRLFANRHLSVGTIVTFLFMGTFGVLPYFLTMLWQNVHGYSALRTGLAFLVPSLAIATGTMAGEQLTARLGNRTALLTGFGLGVFGTVALAAAFGTHTSYALLVPGMIVSGVGQGIVWITMWITASTGAAAHEQGVTNGIAATTLNLGNAIGLALFTMIADLLGGHPTIPTADGPRAVVFLAAIGMLAGLLATLPLARQHHSPSKHRCADPEPMAVQ